MDVNCNYSSFELRSDDQSKEVTPKRAAIYARTAASQEAENYALAYQIEQCKTYCQKYGYSIEEKHIYSEVYSGKLDYRHRPQLTTLIKAAKQGEFNTVVIFALDRLSRDQAQTITIINELEQQNITVECTNDHDLENTRLMLMHIEQQKIVTRMQYSRAAQKMQQ